MASFFTLESATSNRTDLFRAMVRMSIALIYFLHDFFFFFFPPMKLHYLRCNIENIGMEKVLWNEADSTRKSCYKYILYFMDSALDFGQKFLGTTANEFGCCFSSGDNMSAFSRKAFCSSASIHCARNVFVMCTN